MYVKATRRTMLTLIAMLLCLCLPKPAGAAAFESSAALKAAVAKTAAAAGGELKAVINARYGDFVSLREQESALDSRIKTAHNNNSSALKLLRKRIGRIDADQVARLDNELKQTRKRYEPLFHLYTAQNKQVSIARSFGNKELTSALRAQAEVTKAAVQLARLDIRVRSGKLKAAKSERSRKMKRARQALAAVDPVNAQIKAGRSEAATRKKRAAADWTAFSKAAKKTDAKRTADSLAALVSYERQIVAQKRNILSLESKIGDIAAKVSAQIEGA